MATFTVTPTDTTFSVQVGEDTLAASNSATAAATSAAAAAAAAANIKSGIVYLTQTNSDGRLIEATAAAGGVYPADGTKTVFALTVAGDKTAGAAQVNISGFATLALLEIGGGGVPESRWMAGDTIFFQRPTSSSQFEMISVNRVSRTDLPYATDAEAIGGTVSAPLKPSNLLQYARNRLIVASDLVPPSAARPGRAVVLEDGRVIISVRLRDADYRDGYVRCAGDMIHCEIRNVKPHFSAHAASAEPVWAINAIYATLGGQRVDFANFIWDTIGGDGKTEAGIDPSAFQFMQQVGVAADSVATINAGSGSGIYHGNISVLASNWLVTGGVVNGTAVADSTVVNTAMLTPGSVMYFTALSWQPSINVFAQDGTTLVATTPNMALTFGNGDQITWAPTIHFGSDAKVTYGYMNMLPLNGVNRLQGNGAGKTAVQTVATSGVYDFGAATKVVGWNTNHSGRAVEMEINAAYAPYRINDVAASWSSDAALFVVYDADKAKIYASNFQNSGTADTVNSQKHSGLYYIRAVRADSTS